MTFTTTNICKAKLVITTYGKLRCEKIEPNSLANLFLALQKNSIHGTQFTLKQYISKSYGNRFYRDIHMHNIEKNHADGIKMLKLGTTSGKAFIIYHLRKLHWSMCVCCFDFSKRLKIMILLMSSNFKWCAQTKIFQMCLLFSNSSRGDSSCLIIPNIFIFQCQQSLECNVYWNVRIMKSIMSMIFKIKIDF